MLDLASLTHHHLVDDVGKKYTLEHQGKSLTAQVAAVKPLKKAFTPKGAKRRGFSILLTVPEPCSFGSGEYTIQHPSHGAIGPLHAERIHSGELNATEACFQVILN